METLLKKVESCKGKAREFADEILAKAKDGTLTIAYLQSQQGRWLSAGCISRDLTEVRRTAFDMLQGRVK